jgi:hypothetical protein
MTGMVCLLSSCYSSRKAKIAGVIKSTDSLQQKELNEITKIEFSKNEKLADGKIDSAIDKKINERLANYKARVDSVKQVVAVIKVNSENRKSLRKSYRKILKSKLVYLRSDNEVFEKRSVNYGMITDVLDNSKQTQFDLATFFGSGEFMIPADKIEQAKTAFTPIIDSLLKFAAKYPNLPKNSTIVLKGYADGTMVRTGTPLYYRLSNELNLLTEPTNAALNLALSKLRTESISEIVNGVLKKRQPEFAQQNIIHIELVEEGRGEEKPNPKINDYTDDDARRRIVLFFWSMLPV